MLNRKTLYQFNSSAKFVCICIYLLAYVVGNAQSRDTIIDIIDEDEIEEFIQGSEDEEFLDDTYFEHLESYRTNKININFATREEFEDLDLLSDIQIQNILYYREKFGEFKSQYELLGLEELSKAEINRLLPFFKFNDSADPPKSLKDQFKSGKHSIFLRYTQIVEEKKGYTPADTNSDGSLTSRYLGNPQKYYLRYRFQYGTDLSIGITADHDAGEPFKHPNQKIGVDYLSGHFFLKNRGILKRLVVGDYEMNLGQGLFLQQGYARRKSTEVNSVKKKYLPFKAHTGANEILFSRGLAAEIKIAKQWSVVGFGSYRKVDANAVFDTEDFGDIDIPINVSSIQTSGNHRTESEIADKGSIGIWSGGGSLTYSARKLRLSANTAYFKLSVPLQKADSPTNTFEFSGDKLLNAGLDYQVLNKNVSLFGELAFSDNGGWGMLNGGNFNLPYDIKMTLVHRYYAKNFHTLYGNAFGESSRPINEHGLYLGVNFSPFKYASWSNYIDIYEHKWLRFETDAPSKGIDIQSKLVYRPKYWLKLHVRGKYERKTTNASGNETNIDFLVPHVKSGLQLHLEYKASSQVTLKTRVDFAWYNNGVDDNVNTRDKGILAYQDISYRFNKFPMTLHARYALFQTTSFDAALYAYENDLLYLFTVPSYSGKGSKYYLTAKIDAHRYVKFWIKWSQTIFTDRDVISSGLEEIDGNVRSEIKLQVQFKF